MNTKLPTLEELQEAAFRSNVKKSVERIKNSFTFEEHVQIAFVPLIFCYLALYYGDRCRKYAAQHKISILTKLGRAYDEVKTAWINEIGKDLDLHHRRKVQEQAMRFMQEYALNFQIMWFSANSEIKKHKPGMLYEDMRTDAVCGMLMIDMLLEMNRKIDEIIKGRLGPGQKTVCDPKMESLRMILDAYAGELGGFEIKTKDIALSKRVIMNKVKEIEFEVS